MLPKYNASPMLKGEQNAEVSLFFPFHKKKNK
jgi:hypothetical protein